jgi:hypothetical protein
MLACLLVGAISALHPRVTRADAVTRPVTNLRTESHIVTELSHAVFTARGKNGYKILVKGSSRGVRLVAARRHSAAVYLDREGKANESEIHANFGRLGGISVKFRPDGNIPVGPQRGEGGRCRPPSGALDHAGVFTGRIEFHGELEFTSINRRRVRGTTGPSRLWRCSAAEGRSQGKEGDRERPTMPNLTATGSPGLVFFHAGSEAISEIASLVQGGVPLGLATLPRKGVPFQAGMLEERGDLLIGRYVVAKGKPGSLIVDKRSVTARVAPPAPFSGTAEYKGCGPPRLEWQGSLSVVLPGRGKIALAGRRHFPSGAELQPRSRCPREGTSVRSR